MLGVLSGLVWPQIRVEIEVTAVQPGAQLISRSPQAPVPAAPGFSLVRGEVALPPPDCR